MVTDLRRKQKRLARFQHENRQKPTPAEQTLALLLKDAQIDFRAQKGFIRHAIEFVIADFYFPRKYTVVEVDGPYHDDPRQQERDRRKESVFKKRRMKVLRISNEDIFLHPKEVLAKIRATLRARRPQGS